MAVSAICWMALRAIVSRRRKAAHSRGGACGDSDEFRMAEGNRRQVEAVGLDDLAGLGVSVSPAPAGRTVDGRHQIGANQRVEDVLDLPPSQAERGLELAVGRPDDRPGPGLPILWRAEGEQDVDGVAEARGKAQWRGGLLEGGER